LGLVPPSELSGVEDSSEESDMPVIADEMIQAAMAIENQLATSVVSNPNRNTALVDATTQLATVSVDAVAILVYTPTPTLRVAVIFQLLKSKSLTPQIC